MCTHPPISADICKTDDDMSSEQDHEMVGKVKQLAEAVKELTTEAKRLQSNLEKMHSLQNLMYRVDQSLVAKLTDEGLELNHEQSNESER